MKKISLITLHSVQNYGSVLQTYASQRTLEALGYQVEVADYVRENNLRENLVKTGLANSRFWNRNAVARGLYTLLKRRSLYKRYDLFDAFLKRYIHLSPLRYHTDEDFRASPPQADIYCTGSDQTWNSYWNRGLLCPFFLCYAPEGKPKISYAASFGKKSLDPEEEREIAALLQSYRALTVREQEAVEIIERMGLPAQRVLDPTLMLTLREWRELMSPRAADKDYILIYQLNSDAYFSQCAKDFAKARGMPLIRVGFGVEAYAYGGMVAMNPTPEEFLALIDGARFLLTDSFHATGFAVNFHVPFACYLPRRFSGRITDLLALVGCPERTFSEAAALEALWEQAPAFGRIEAALQRERAESLEILRKILNECQ